MLLIRNCVLILFDSIEMKTFFIWFYLNLNKKMKFDSILYGIKKILIRTFLRIIYYVIKAIIYMNVISFWF